MPRGLRFVKGHGTENDFVLVPDADGALGDLDPALVAALCDRRAGLGADGVIRVVRTAATDDPHAAAAIGQAEWFMDYRNADGSLSEMCGNGVRVFARYLVEREGLPTAGPQHVATRAGVKTLTFGPGGEVTADLGTPVIAGETVVGVGASRWPATHVSIGNPHAVAFVTDLSEPGALTEPPEHDPKAYPDGVNVEFVARRGPRHVAMRVHERGSGETRSCGTGACAAMVAAAAADGAGASTYRVDVPGGTLHVTWTEEGRVLLTGPAVLVAEGNWLAGP